MLLQNSEYTCFYVKVLDKHLITAIDILSDMLNDPKFTEEDIENEKKVILEEINMYLDSPEDIVFDMVHERVCLKEHLYPFQYLVLN